jgi:hypothetical protein
VTSIAAPQVAEPEPTTDELAVQAALAEARFLDSVRRRVAWQAEQAARLRAIPRAPKPPLDLLDVSVVERLLAEHASAPRAAEWAAFLEELRELADENGRLPDIVDRLVAVVFADLL